MERRAAQGIKTRRAGNGYTEEPNLKSQVDRKWRMADSTKLKPAIV